MIQTIPVQVMDEAFLFAVYSSTRQEEIAVLGWAAPQAEAFLRMQFTAMHRSYALQYPDADHRIILWDNQPAGRMMVHRGAEAIRLVDIALLPEFRNVGIGSELIRSLQHEAGAAGKVLRLSALSGGRARPLYERLGFTTVHDDGMYCAMEWRPPQPPLP